MFRRISLTRRTILAISDNILRDLALILSFLHNRRSAVVHEEYNGCESESIAVYGYEMKLMSSQY